MSDFEELQNEEELNIITLTDEDGSEIDYEFLDLIDYEDKTYVVLLPVDESEDNGEVIILEVNEIDDETEEYASVEDEATLSAVFDIFRERFQDEFNFVD